MNLLAESSDAVQIATLITGLIATMFGGVMTYLIAKLNTKQAKAAEAAIAVKEQLKANTAIADDKLNSIASTAEDVLERVNGATKAQLEINATSARTLAEITNEKEHKERARVADDALAAHIRTDSEIKGKHFDESIHKPISQE
jgi:phosphopantothenate synthetase